MRVLLDTNVLIAAYASTRGACAALFEHCVRNHTVLTSESILAEFQEFEDRDLPANPGPSGQDP